MLFSLLRRYDSWLQQYPVLTKTISAVVIATGADVSCQHIQEHMFHNSDVSRVQTAGTSEDFVWDKSRTLRMVAFTAGMTPLVHQWYGFLTYRFPHPLARVAADQLMWAPPGTAFFLWAMQTMQTGSPEQGLAEAREKTREALTANWMVWPVVQSVNFTFVPTRYQILFVNGASFFWSIFMSELSNRKKGPVEGMGQPAPALPQDIKVRGSEAVDASRMPVELVYALVKHER